MAAVEESAERFAKALDALDADFKAHGPFTSSWKSYEAMAELSAITQKARILLIECSS
jgi:hypothetical protein